MKTACRKRWDNDRIHWIAVVVLALAWVSALFFFIKPSALRKAEENLFAYGRAADASVLHFDSNQRVSPLLAKLIRINSENLHKDGSEIFDAAVECDRLPQGALGNWGLFFHVLEDKERASRALERIDDSNEYLSQQKKLLKALVEGDPVSEELSDWAQKNYQEGVAELPEWYYLAYHEDNQVIRQWLEARGAAMVMRGILADAFAVFVIVISLGCLIWFVVARKRLPQELRHERFRKSWRMERLLLEFLVAEFFAYGAAWAVSYLLILLGFYHLSMICAGILFMLVPVAWLLYRLTPGLSAATRVFGLRDTAWKRRELILFGIAGVSPLIATALLLKLLDPSWLEVSDSISSEGLDSWITVLWGFVFAGIFAPVCEEVIFRGFLFGGLRNRLGAVPASLLSSCIFGCLHFYSWVGLAVVIVYGLLFCYLYSRSNSLWPGMIAHSIFNFVATAEMVGWLSFH